MVVMVVLLVMLELFLGCCGVGIVVTFDVVMMMMLLWQLRFL